MNFETPTLIFEFVASLVVLIIVHEFGHFIAARLLKVEVEEFGIGFPPRALTLFKAGGTIFSLNWIPLGGFVRPKGENDPNVPGGLAAASPWVRLAVLFAGPLMNLLTGAILYAVIFLQIGQPDLTRVEILEVAANSPAAQAGLLPGDIVVSVADQPITSTQSLHDTIYANLDTEVEVKIERGGEIVTTKLVPRSSPPEGEGAIGIVMGNPLLPVGPVDAFYQGGNAVYQQSISLLLLPGRALRGELSPEEGRLVGYKGMYDIYSEVREQDQLAAPGAPRGINTLAFIAAISVSLGLLNLFPVPALDGGRILFTLPEIVLRRRVPPAYENLINLVSFSLLILLMIYVNVQDFVNPVSLP